MVRSNYVLSPLIDLFSRPSLNAHLHNDVMPWRQNILCGLWHAVEYSDKMQYLLVVKMSDYTESLSADDVADYKAKLTLDNGMILPDPFGVDKSQRVNNVTAWPPLAFADIFQYFVVSRHYSLDESENWKTLDGYNYFANCHVQQVLLHVPHVDD